MNRENATRWVAALRSGDYDQGRNALNNDGKLCCLGVACEVAIENGVQIQRRTNAWGGVTYDDTDSALPVVVQEWLGVDSSDPRLGNATAVILNDERRETFEQIAQAIEKEAGLA